MKSKDMPSEDVFRLAGEYLKEEDEYQDKFEKEVVPETFAGEDKRVPVGIVSWSGNQYEVFTSGADYIACIKEEIDYRATSGFKFNTLINDPVILKSVDDIVYDFYGDENPNDIEYYKMKASDLSSEERIQSSPLMNEYKAYILAERSEEFEDDELEG